MSARITADTNSDGAPVHVVLCGRSLCFKTIGAFLSETANREGPNLVVHFDDCGDEVSRLEEDVGVVFVCASQCSGRVHTSIYSAVRARYPEAQCIAMSQRAQAGNLVTALDAGAQGFIACGIDGFDDIVRALHTVLSGDIAFSTEVSRRIVDRLRYSSSGQQKTAVSGSAALELTDREHGVLALLSEGLSNKQIAGALGLSPNTVKNHLARIYQKLGVQSRAEAVSLAIKSGLA